MYTYKNALTLDLNIEDGILEKYASTKQRNTDMHVRKEAEAFEKEAFEYLGYEIEEIIENEDDERVVALNDYLSVKFEIKNQYSDVYEIDVKVHEFDSSAVFGDIY